MDKEKKKKMEQKNELTNSGQRFPVEQVSNTGKPTKKQVKAAVKELNPDVNSLVLLSEIFQISLDNLIKGDIEVMKDVIQKEEIEKMNRYGKTYTIMLIATAVSAVPLFMWLGVWAFIPWGIVWAISMYFAFKVEKVKKDNDVQTYKEIVAFSEGKRLDDIHKQREIGKRPYQKILLVVVSTLITVTVWVLIWFLMHIFLN